MNNKIQAKILSFNEHIEEEVTILVDNVVLTCFASYCPYEIKRGKVYSVEFSFQFFDDNIFLEKSDLKIKSIKKSENDYSYIIYGELVDNTLDAGIKFLDIDLFEECWDLKGKFVKLKVDRLDISFI